MINENPKNESSIIENIMWLVMAAFYTGCFVYGDVWLDMVMYPIRWCLGGNRILVILFMCSPILVPFVAVLVWAIYDMFVKEDK